MIEITKKGIAPKDKKYKYVCSQCDTEFIFQQSDLKSGVEDHLYYIYCPVCKYGHGEESINSFESYNG